MTNRERFHSTLNFEKVDRLPMLEWAVWWDKTLARWKDEGLVIRPVKGLNEAEALRVQFGTDLLMQEWIGFFTPKTPKPAYHGAPLASTMAEYEALKPALFPENPVDPDRMREIARRQASGEAITWLTLEGPFWGPRSIMGIEGHLLGFFDEPELMHAINRDLTEYNMRVYREVTKYFVPDFMTFAEDMSYNNGPMLSEKMFDEFMLPYYQAQIPAMRRKGTRIFIDSDGDITLALPWFLRAGIEGIAPLERQAGMDLEKLRKRWPKCLFIGHFDKMTMPLGEAAMRAEFERLLPVMRQGGFLPSVDHQTPPGVSLENYHIYLRLFREYAVRSQE